MENLELPAAAAGRGRLGDATVRRAGFGAMSLTGWPSGRQPDRDTALAVLRRAVELGVDHIDTCHYYSRDGMSANALIRAALHPYPKDLFIATKVGPIMEGDEELEPGFRVGLRPSNLRRAVEANLTELGVDRLDLVNLRMDPLVTPAEGSLETAMETLAELRQEGLIRHLGISNVLPEHVERARRIAPLVCVQNRYSLAYRKYDALVDACEAAGTAFVPYFPVSRFDADTTARAELVAARHGATVTQVALAWLLQRSPSILLISGTGSPAHLEENIAAAALRLTRQDLLDLA